MCTVTMTLETTEFLYCYGFYSGYLYFQKLNYFMNESYRKVTYGSYFLVKNKSKRYVECYDSLKKLEHHLNKQKYLKCTDFNVKFKQSLYEKIAERKRSAL